MIINYHLLTMFCLQPSSNARQQKQALHNNRPKRLLLQTITYLSIGQCAGNACLVLSKSTLLNLSIVCILTFRAAWFKVAFVSPVKNLSVKVYLKGPVLMLWPYMSFNNLSIQTSHSSGDAPP